MAHAVRSFHHPWEKLRLRPGLQLRSIKRTQRVASQNGPQLCGLLIATKGVSDHHVEASYSRHHANAGSWTLWGQSVPRLVCGREPAASLSPTLVFANGGCRRLLRCTEQRQRHPLAGLCAPESDICCRPIFIRGLRRPPLPCSSTRTARSEREPSRNSPQNLSASRPAPLNPRLAWASKFYTLNNRCQDVRQCDG